MPTENIRERLSDVAKMDQQPKDRLWGALAALAIMILVLGGIMMVSFTGLQNYLKDGRELADQRGAVNCIQTFIDNEWTELGYGLPDYCRLPQVFVHYPPALCERALPLERRCGTEWDDGA